MGYHDGTPYDSPVEGAINAIKKLKNKGYDVVVFTAREDLEPVDEWFRKHCNGWSLEITNKKPPAIAYIDDRAIRFTNWKDILNYF